MKRPHAAAMTGSVLLLALSVAGCTPDKAEAPAPFEASAAPPVAPSIEAVPEQPVPAGATARVELAPAVQGSVNGMLELSPVPGGVHLVGRIAGLVPNGEQGFHIHEKGDCSAPDFSSAGGHFNPQGHDHGKPGSVANHAGDMLNLTANAEGVATVDVVVPDITLGTGEANDVVERAIVVHAAADDYASQPAGNSGARIACGVISQ